VSEVQEIARGGVIVSLGADGPFKIECRFVRPEDEPRAEIDPLDGDGDNADSESKRSAVV